MKNLNNQNLPLSIGNNFPVPCVKSEITGLETNKTFLDTTYYDSIKYIFEDPVLIKNEQNQFLTLGNVPVDKIE